MRWVKLYSAILREPLLTTSARLIYSIIKSYSSKAGVCWPSKERIAEEAGCSTKTVNTGICELWFFGVLTWNSGFKGKANTYFFNDEAAAAKIMRNEAPRVSFQAAVEANKKAMKEHQKEGATTPLTLPYPTLLKLPTKENHSKGTSFQDFTSQAQEGISKESLKAQP